MEQIKFSANEFIYYGAIAGAILGLLFGIFLLILGFVKKERGYGIFGLLSSVVVGPISGLLSIIVAVIFTWLILRKKKEIVAEVTPDENLMGVKTEHPENC